MPTYEYLCEDCGCAFELFATVKQKTAGLEPECPQCHSTRVRQAFRSVMFVRDGSGSIAPMPSGGGCCPGGSGTC